VPEHVVVHIQNRSFTIFVDLDVESPDAEGVLVATGSRFGGYTLYVKDGRHCFEYSFVGLQTFKCKSDQRVPSGHVTLGVVFTKLREDPKGVANGALKMYINDDLAAEGRMKVQPGPFGLAGTGLVVGRDGPEGVSEDYRAPFPFKGGAISSVTINVSGEPSTDLEKEGQAMFSRQ
jgi:arylsulfatase